MVTHFSGMIPLTHGYTLLWYDTREVCNTCVNGIIPEKCVTILWYDTIKCVTHVLMVSYQRSVTHSLV